MREDNFATFVDLAPLEDDFRTAVLAGLARPRKAIPCRFLYDARGSQLFGRICELPEYYITRTETGILEAHAKDIAALAGPNCHLIEFGSGAGTKVQFLLAAFADPSRYTAIDISPAALHRAAEGVTESFPGVEVTAVCADFTDPKRLPASLFAPPSRRIGFFPGSTIGNLTPEEAVRFLRGCRSVLGPDSAMIVGVDLKKDAAVLNAAYNDSAGVTAEFTLNLLARMNRELGANFDAARFRHDASYAPAEGRMEIYIQSLMDQIVSVAGRRVSLARNERIHVEYSYKYAVAEFQELATRAGFRPAACWTDADEFFGVHYLNAA